MSDDDRYKPTPYVELKTGVTLRMMPLMPAFALFSWGAGRGFGLPAILALSASAALVVLAALLLRRYWTTI